MFSNGLRSHGIIEESEEIRMDKESIVLGSGDLYCADFQGTNEAIPDDAVIETEDNRLGHIKGGAEIEYAPEFYEAKDDMGKVSKVIITEEELLRATEEIQNLTYRQGEYKIFKVFEPKERLIMALPFYDRVVQHMICNAIQPVFENGFYYHSYACRSGKGMHAASDTLYQWMYETEVKQGLRMYAFKGDISKYFASIPHDKLKDENRRYIGDKKALMLMDDIIDHNGILPDGVGIPVGNLTSQLFANVYGNKLDKFCKHVLHIPYFVRYMDDFIILSDDLEQLKEWVKRIEEFLENEMLLHINPKSTILYAGNGIDFCGYIHYADHKKVRKSSIRKLKQDVKAYELGELPPEEFNRKYESRKGHLGHADTYHIAKAVEYELLFYEWERLEAAV